MACCTASLVAPFTAGSALSTRETVAIDTPAFSATALSFTGIFGESADKKIVLCKRLQSKLKIVQLVNQNFFSPIDKSFSLNSAQLITLKNIGTDFYSVRLYG